MKKFSMSVALLCAANAAMAFAEVGQWSSGWGQGASEYQATADKNTTLYIACGDGPVTMTLTVGGKTYGSGKAKGFDLVVDGKEVQTPYDTNSRVGADNFRYAWDAMRKAKRLQARTADGKIVELPVKGAAKALPATSSNAFSCNVEF